MQRTLDQRVAWGVCLVVILTLVASVLPPIPASAASGRVSALPALLRNMRPMQVRIVRSAEPGCEPDCAEWISAEGDLVDTTPNDFRRVLARLGQRRLPVFVNSGGGSIEAAMVVGRMLRSRGLDVSVTRTDFSCPTGGKGCDPPKVSPAGEDRGLPDSFNAYCASACTLVLAAGIERLASPWSHVGVHSIVVFKTQFRVRRTYRVTTLTKPNGGVVTRKTLIREQRLGAQTTQLAVNDSTYAPMEIYLSEMGIAQSLVPLMESTPNSDIHWMTQDEESTTHIVTSRQSGDALLKHPAVASAVRALAALSDQRSSPTNSPDPSARITVPMFFQGRLSLLQLGASFERSTAATTLTTSLKAGEQVLRSQGLYVSLGFGGGHTLNAYAASASDPLSPLTVRALGAQICPLRESRVLELSLHPVRAQDDEFVPLEETRPIAVPVDLVSGLAELLTAACIATTAAGK